MQAFARTDDRRLNLLILIGSPGLGKSQSVKRAQKGSYCMIEGSASAIDIYIKAYHYMGDPLIIDDVDDLLMERRAKPLLKCLCQSDTKKRMAWNTQTPLLEKHGVPNSYHTTSNVCIIANDWQALDKNVGAIQDRGTLIFFEPSAEAVHEKVLDAGWFKDSEIYAFIGDHLHLIADPTFRDYITALEWKQNEIDWRAKLIEVWTSEDLRRVWILENDPKLRTTDAKVREFARRGWGSRATYFRHKGHLTGR